MIEVETRLLALGCPKVNVQVRGADVALDATNSEVIVTASDLSGEIAVRADASRLDFAGVSLLALETPLEVKRRSRVIASTDSGVGAVT